MNPITTHKQAESNIKLFNKEVMPALSGSVGADIDTLISNMPHYRAWYCLYDEQNDSYLFAPSKYIGYLGINASIYAKFNRTGLDGRQTEGVLATWYETISSNHADYKKLSQKLMEFCSLFGKKPNSLFRINIPLNRGKFNCLDKQVADFIWNAYKCLPEEIRTELKNKIIRYKEPE